jgi:hydrogenase maturation protease
MDLAYALGRGYDSAILLDAVMPRGAPGRLHLIELEAEREDDGAMFDNHHMDPVGVIGLARRIGTLPPKIFLVGCEPENWTNEESMSLELSPIVTRSVEGAIKIVLELAERLLGNWKHLGGSADEKSKGALK